MDSSSVGVHLFMRDAIFDKVDLKGMEISDYLDMDRATFKGKLDMDSASVGVNLFMRKAELGLKSSKDRRIEYGESTFKGPLIMGSVSVGAVYT